MRKFWVLVAFLCLIGCLPTQEAGLTESGGETPEQSTGYVFDEDSSIPEKTSDEGPQPLAPLADEVVESANAEPEPETEAETRPDPNSAARLACEERKGSFAKTGSGFFVCVKPTGEAMKSCSTANDCSSACLARSRTCAPITPLIGCHEILTKNGTRASVCLD